MNEDGLRPVTYADDSVERGAAALVGRRIHAVRYVALTAGGEHGWARGDDGFDTPEFGVDLELDDGQIIALTWSVQDTGLEVLHGSLTQALWNPGTWTAWDVSDRSRWVTYLGKDILHATVYREQISDDATALPIPLCMTLTFGPDDRIYICAAQYREERDELVVGGDEIVIFFHDRMVRRYYPDLLAQ